MSKVVVIGAGVSGLAVAARLASSGFEVHVYEKNAFAGGKVSAVRIADYIWDIHPNQTINLSELKKLYRDCRQSFQRYIKPRPYIEKTDFVYASGQVLSTTFQTNSLASEINNKLNEPRRHVTNYLADAKHVYKLLLRQTELPRAILHSSETLRAISRGPLQLLTRNLHAENQRRFARPESQWFFDRSAQLRGSDPARAPAFIMYESYVEQTSKRYFFKGGFHTLTSSLCRLAADCGVVIHYSEEVKKITHQNGQVTGIITPKGWVEANVVVSAIDIGMLYREMLPATKRIQKYALAERSLSTITFCWGIRKKIKKLSTYSVFLSGDPKLEQKKLWKQQELPNDPTISVTIQSRMHKQYASSGGEAWVVQVAVPSLRGQRDWPGRMRQVVLDKLTAQLGVQIEELIDYETVLTADDLEQQFGLNHGSLYGAASHKLRPTLFRHPNASPDFGKLYFVGETVRPGPGLTLALCSAETVAAKIRTEEK